MLSLFRPNEAAHVPRKTILQIIELTLPIASGVARSAVVDVWGFEQSILANIARAVFFVEDKVPGEC